MAMPKNFSLHEFGCHDGTDVPEELIENVEKLANELQIIRDHINKPIRVTSGYRTKKYNSKLNGAASKSQHLVAKASDIQVIGLNPRELHSIIEKLIKEKAIHNGGLGLYRTFVHYDIRNKPTRW